MHDERVPLLIIEDDPAIGAMTAEMLGDDYRVTLVMDGAEGLGVALRGDFEAIVLDRRLPGYDGMEVVAELRRSGVPTPVLMLTALGTVPDRVAGLDAGADDYLVKPFDLAELAARLRAIRRVHVDDEQSLPVGTWELRPGSRMIESPYEGRVVLTETETKLLHLLARHPEQTFSRERILREVFPVGNSLGTVDTYVHYLRKKTEWSVITTVHGRGYRLGRP